MVWGIVGGGIGLGLIGLAIGIGIGNYYRKKIIRRRMARNPMRHPRSFFSVDAMVLDELEFDEDL